MEFQICGSEIRRFKYVCLIDFALRPFYLKNKGEPWGWHKEGSSHSPVQTPPQPPFVDKYVTEATESSSVGRSSCIPAHNAWIHCL